MIDKQKYQVFLFTSPYSIPCFFSAHYWLVVNNRGVVSRWEVLRRQKPTGTGKKHLYLNYFSPFQGAEIVSYFKNFFWRGKVLGSIEGEAARRIAEFIENSPTAYPFGDHYSLIGPNCNTYAQWVLDKFPQFEAKLAWNSFGKNYLVPQT